MGLSASQARLLTITARKSDCEFQSMMLSHQKIALSRDMERISQDYQNALNQTKLVYDYYGTFNSDIDVAYGLLMTPSVYNDYYPRLVTDSKNRVVLNAAYAAAARAAGIPIEGLIGTPSSDVRNKFIAALGASGVITPGLAETIQNVPYANDIGLGSTDTANIITEDVSYDELLQMIAAYSMDSGSYGVNVGMKVDSNFLDKEGSSLYQQNFIMTDSNGKIINGKRYYEYPTNAWSFTLADLLSNDINYNLAYTSKRDAYATDGAYQLQVDLCEGTEKSAAILDWIYDAFAAVLGGVQKNNLALEYAYNAVFDLIYPNDKLKETLKDTGIGDAKTTAKDHQASEAMNSCGTLVDCRKNSYAEGFNGRVPEKADKNIGMVYDFNPGEFGAFEWNMRWNDNSTVAVNLNNLAQVFLTAYVESMKGIENSDYNYNKGAKSNSNLYDPNEDDFKFNVVTGTSISSDDACLYAGFYDALFNQICMNGWTENDKIDDSNYLQELMKSGMVFISSISNDGYYYQGNYATDPYISEVVDDEAIARAEAKYNTEKAKIQTKEDTIDLKMKNLDTEISALTTEYDTTKSVLQKAIERSIKRYDA